MVTHMHKMPHVLVLRVGACFFKLPGGVLDDGENVATGLHRILTKLFGKPITRSPATVGSSPAAEDCGRYDVDKFPCVIRDVVSNWWRPNFEPTEYPYLPAHVTHPKARTMQRFSKTRDSIHRLKMQTYCNKTTMDARWQMAVLIDTVNT
jgi:cleavage and polyadenylation specificity factor subunit 5